MAKAKRLPPKGDELPKSIGAFFDSVDGRPFGLTEMRAFDYVMNAVKLADAKGTMTLYLITDTDPDDVTNNRDLFVWADTPAEAAVAWDKYYEEQNCFPCKVTIREVPTVPQRGAVTWDQVKRHTHIG